MSVYLIDDEDQEQFRRVLREFFARRLNHAELPRVVRERDGDDPTLWNAMTNELGLPGLTVSEELDGQGYGVTELCLVMHEAGYALLPGSLFATTCLAAQAAKRAGGDAADRVLQRIARGAVAALAIDDADGGSFGAVATPAGDAHRLSGRKTRVAAGAEAELILVSATTPEGPSLLVVEADADGLVREPSKTFDHTRPMASIALDDVEAQVLGRPGDGEDVLEATLGVARVALASEQAGGAERCLAIAVEHAQQRMAFGRAIGSFQAVKHRCADTYADVEAARSATRYAAAACDREDDAGKAVAVACAIASDAYLAAARTCIQVLGAIGFTAEHPAQLHFRRATASALWFGGSSSSLEELAAFALGERI